MSSSKTNNHWQSFAQKWNRLGSPLRPCAEDVENFRLAMGSTSGRCLLLGVTPELAGLSARLTAIDNCAAMIGALWPGKQPALQGDWLALPFQSATFDTIVGDGCLTLLSHPRQYQKFFAQLQRALTPGGRILLRVFASPEQRESRELVCREALNGKIKSFHAFKWRLSMAIASESVDHTFDIAETYASFERLIPDRHLLAAATGWNIDTIETIDIYRGSTAQYSYPTLSQVRACLPPGLTQIDMIFSRYELAERCPILVLGSGG